MKHFDIETFIKDLDKQFNDMQDKAIAGSENVATASWVIKQQQSEIDALKKTIESLFGGLESSLALNKAQTERNQ
jgi:peptidoglycan hydrolase CwlO-like protein